jgi:hypothetical protein
MNQAEIVQNNPNLNARAVREEETKHQAYDRSGF